MTERVAFSVPAVARGVAAVRKSGQPVRGVHFPPEGGFTVLTGEPIELPIPDRSGEDRVVIPL